MPQKTLLAAIVILLGNVIFGYFIYQNNKNRLSSEHWVQHTMEVQYKAKKIIASEQHMSTLLNAYQLDGRKAFRPSIDATIKELKADVDSLTTLTRDNKLQHGRSILLNKYLTTFFTELNNLNYAEESRLSTTGEIVIIEKRFANQVNYLIGAILKEEGKLLAKRKEAYSNNVTEFTWFSIYMFMAISIFTILLLLATRKIFVQSDEKNQRADELNLANKRLSLANLLKQKKAGELILATKELFFQKREKRKRAEELVIANKELSFQNEEKEKRAEELVLANIELLFQSEEKEKRAEELISANIELSFQNKEKEKRANELSIANTELSFQNKEKEKRAFELKEVIQRLNKSELFNRGILNSLSSHIGVMDHSGKLIAVNESWNNFALENKQTTLSRIPVGNNYFDECNKATKNGDLISAIALQGIKDVMEKKKPFFYLEYPCHSLSEERWFGMRAIKFESEDDMVVVSHLNITERKLAENNLSVSESRLKEAQSIAHLGNFEMNLVEKFDIWSDEMYQILGLEKTELSPSVKQFLRFIHPDDLKKTRQNIEEVFNNLAFKSVEFRFYKKDGTLRYGYCQSQFELDNTGRPIRLFGIFQDITNSKLAELERTKMVKDLSQRNKDLEQFGYIVSHNLRAPVANIIGATTILGDQSLSKPDKAMLRSAINISVSN